MATQITEKTGTRQERVQRREDIIVQSARDMFLSNGFNGTTMAMIARAAHVADGTLYTYFQNKEALARAVVRDFYTRLTASAQDGVDALTDTRERLSFLAQHHMTNVIRERRILEIMPLIDLQIEHYADSDLFDLNKTYVTIFDRVVKDGQARGEIAPHMTLWIMRDVFFGSLDYGSRTMLIKKRPEAVDQFVREMIDMMLVKHPYESTPLGKTGEQLDAVVTRLEAVANSLEKGRMP